MNDVLKDILGICVTFFQLIVVLIAFVIIHISTYVIGRLNNVR